MSEWQPIETAPKDGRGVLLYSVDGHVHLADWNIDYWSSDHSDFYDDDFTNWMPLPEPPK